jgi:hypothetical protein
MHGSSPRPRGVRAGQRCTLGRNTQACDRLDADYCGNHWHLGLNVEPAGDLFGGCDREILAGHLGELTALELVIADETNHIALTGGGSLQVAVGCVRSWPLQLFGSRFAQKRLRMQVWDFLVWSNI